MMKKTRRDSGFAIMLVLIAVALAVVMGTSYVSSAAIKAAGTRNLLKAARARYLAESGMQHAMYLLWTDPNTLSGTSLTSPLGPFSADNTSAQYRLWATPDVDEIGLYHATARATSEGLTQDVLWDVYRTPPYDQLMLGMNPTGYWRFGEASGTTAQDLSGAGHDLTCHNGVTLGLPGAVGVDTAIGLDGSNDYLYRPPTDDLQIKTDLTISLWFNADQLPEGTDKAYLLTCSEEGENPQNNALYELAINSSGHLEYLHEYGAGHDQGTTFTTFELTPNVWHNLVVTRDVGASTVRVYLEGALIATWTYGSPGPSQPNVGKKSGLYVGSAWGEEAFFDGKIDELGLTDHVMSDQQINTLYQVGGTPEKIELRRCVK